MGDSQIQFKQEVATITERGKDEHTIKGKPLMKCGRKGDRKCLENLQKIVARTKHIEQQIKSAIQKEQNIGVQQMPTVSSEYKHVPLLDVTQEIQTQKCLAFWRTVMQTNIDPNTCKLINTFECEKDESESYSNPKKHRHKRKCKRNTLKKSLKVNSPPSFTQSEMFKKILNEVETENLNKMKMVVKQKCARHNENHTSEITKKSSRVKGKANDMDEKSLGDNENEGSVGKTNDMAKENEHNENDVKPNSTDHLIRRKGCSCSSNSCKCEQDLATILQKLGKGPCICGKTQCICRKNLLTSNSAHVYKTPKEQSTDNMKLETSSKPVFVESIMSNSDIKKSKTESTKSSSIKTEKCQCNETNNSETKCIKTCNEKNLTSDRRRHKANTNRIEESIESHSKLSEKPNSELTGKNMQEDSSLQPNKMSSNKNSNHKGQNRRKTSKTASQIEQVNNIRTISHKPERRPSYSTKFGKDINMQPRNVSQRRVSCFSGVSSEISSTVSQNTKNKCNCGYPDCDCEPVSKQKTNSKGGQKCICSCGHKQCDCKIGKRMSKTLEDMGKDVSLIREILKGKPLTGMDEMEEQSTSLSEDQASIHLNICTCKFPDCDCDAALSQEKLQGKGCKCEFTDCDCGHVKESSIELPQVDSKQKLEVLTALREKHKKPEEHVAKGELFYSVGVQCSAPNVRQIRERKYCYICGYYDCPCEVSRLVF